MDTTKRAAGRTERARYEFRVWGRHRRARKILARLVGDAAVQSYVDCYVFTDDPTWNAKVRGNRLKVKRLVATDEGFERWTRGTYHPSEQSPDAISSLFIALDAERDRLGRAFDLAEVVPGVAEQIGVRVVLVRKIRQQYRVGEVRVEVTDIEVDETGEVLRTLSIEGDDLGQLVKLRKKLGLSGEPNLAMHQALDQSSVSTVPPSR